ncbi:hypothetical protein DPMN_038687 [Dreissena polymorpha]|uniref:Uncharacterized protein n=1 Tax=Dreissena polymorpha TaxID=45954 RepID=A0A9D4MFR8_DREPO|nr:hypothetical protein DPMN_038687 [Dreissena polymorpha]
MDNVITDAILTTMVLIVRKLVNVAAAVRRGVSRLTARVNAGRDGPASYVTSSAMMDVWDHNAHKMAPA